MATHLYVCDNGGPMVVATEGTPPPWVTCPVCTASECTSCDGAQLRGPADDFAEGITAVFRCPAGHEKTLRVPAKPGVPESVQCVECEAMMLAV